MGYARRLKRPKTGGSPLPGGKSIFFSSRPQYCDGTPRTRMPSPETAAWPCQGRRVRIQLPPPERPQTFSPSRDDALVALFRRDALLEQVEMGLEHDFRLHVWRL